MTSDPSMSEQDDIPHFPRDDLKVDFGRIMKDATDPKKLADFRRQEDERRERELREQAQRARRDALAAFIVWRTARGVAVVWTCPGCGALVTDREKHLDWHGGLRRRFMAAHDASWRMRPIG